MISYLISPQNFVYSEIHFTAYKRHRWYRCRFHSQVYNILRCYTTLWLPSVPTQRPRRIINATKLPQPGRLVSSVIAFLKKTSQIRYYLIACDRVISGCDAAHKFRLKFPIKRPTLISLGWVKEVKYSRRTGSNEKKILSPICKRRLVRESLNV